MYFADKTERKLAMQKYHNKKLNARKRGIDMEMTFDEYCAMLWLAGISIYQVGRAPHEYCVSRVGDEGDYSFNNCEFVTTRTNNSEQRTRTSNKRRSVKTPWGTFKSVSQAVKHSRAKVVERNILQSKCLCSHYRNRGYIYLT